MIINVWNAFQYETDFSNINAFKQWIAKIDLNPFVVQNLLFQCDFSRVLDFCFFYILSYCAHSLYF